MKLFGKNSSEVDWEKLEFVYVIFKPYVPIKDDRGIWNPNFLGTWEWGVKGVGFGEVSMYRMAEGEANEQFYFDTEEMSKGFLKQMFNYFVQQSITDKENPDNLKPEFDRVFKPL